MFVVFTVWARTFGAWLTTDYKTDWVPFWEISAGKHLTFARLVNTMHGFDAREETNTMLLMQKKEQKQ